jgi:hypothetical protein
MKSLVLTLAFALLSSAAMADNVYVCSPSRIQPDFFGNKNLIATVSGGGFLDLQNPRGGNTVMIRGDLDRVSADAGSEFRVTKLTNIRAGQTLRPTRKFGVTIYEPNAHGLNFINVDVVAKSQLFKFHCKWNRGG